MFSTVFIDISHIFVQLGLEHFWKIVKKTFIDLAIVDAEFKFKVQVTWQGILYNKTSI